MMTKKQAAQKIPEVEEAIKAVEKDLECVTYPESRSALLQLIEGKKEHLELLQLHVNGTRSEKREWKRNKY